MVGLGPVRNQVSAAKKLQTPSRTTTTTTILVAFVALNKLLGKGGLGHRERRRSSVRLAGAAARFDAVPARAHAAGGVRMRFRHRAARVEHQRAPALRAHQASRSHRTVIGRCGFAFACAMLWRGTCKFIECHVSWPLSSTAPHFSSRGAGWGSELALGKSTVKL